MNGILVRTALAALFGVTAFAAPILAQNEQFIPNFVYRTSASVPNGTLGCRSDTDPGPTSTQGQTQYIVTNRIIA